VRSPATLCAVGAIGAYQRYISPHKGFRCAHRACTGGPSCSAYAKHALLELGFLNALPRIRQQLVQCSEYATDPRKGKINEDDPGPLTSKECNGAFDGLACVGCAIFDPVAWWFS
jgi:putative component of membrane protein insertase Oxa1/YidC/SpoIIIJ protein YidD